MPLIRNLTLSKKNRVIGEPIDPNIALGNTLLTTNSKVRAYWDFTEVVGNDWDLLADGSGGRDSS